MEGLKVFLTVSLILVSVYKSGIAKESVSTQQTKIKSEKNIILKEKIQCNKGEDKNIFVSKVDSISSLLQINTNWLMALMYKESRLNAQSVNRQKGDCSDPYIRCKKRGMGLIGFMPQTAKDMGTTTQQMYNMTNIEQLDYVYIFFKPYTGKIKSYSDLYFITFFPAGLGKPDWWVLKSKKLSPQIIAKQNSGIDFNKDHKLTVSEVNRWILKNISKDNQTELKNFQNGYKSGN